MRLSALWCNLGRHKAVPITRTDVSMTGKQIVLGGETFTYGEGTLTTWECSTCHRELGWSKGQWNPVTLTTEGKK